jgi:tyrosine aminotransferase
MAESVGKVDGYTDFQGSKATREAVAAKFKTKAHAISADDVYLTAGGSLAIWTVMNLLGGEGDNFLFPSPGFPLALTIARSMGLQPRFYHLQADNRWQASIE